MGAYQRYFTIVFLFFLVLSVSSDRALSLAFETIPKDRSPEDISLFSYYIHWERLRDEVLKVEKAESNQKYAVQTIAESIQDEMNHVNADIALVESVLPAYRASMRRRLKTAHANDLTQKIKSDLDQEDRLFAKIFEIRKALSQERERKPPVKTLTDTESTLFKLQLEDTSIKEGNLSLFLQRNYLDLVFVRRNLFVLCYGGRWIDTGLLRGIYVSLGYEDLLTRLRVRGWKPENEIPKKEPVFPSSF